jgi:hypothetical protein
LAGPDEADGETIPASWLGEYEIMTDIIFIAIGVGFFALSIAYTHACEKLRGGGQ